MDRQSAERVQVVEAIATLGDAAIPGVREYLDRGPQVVPQPRCFVVTMLARLSAEAATEGLREVLLGDPLKLSSAPWSV